MLSPLPDHLYDCRFIGHGDDTALLQTILKLSVTEIPTVFGFNPLTDIQVLSPMHRGTVGCSNLNRELQKLLNPGPSGLDVGENVLKVGDKVLQTENNYLKDVYNGDIIQGQEINSETQEVRCSYEGRQISYDYHELEQLIPAYAISVHKSQGSEYPAVVIPVSMEHIGMLQRNLLYTAITRGKNS